ncbi:MAG: recombinase [Chloroflexi bacterium]|nr:recombinase [Chloroflexota bacterium]
MSDGHDIPGFDHSHDLLQGENIITEEIEGLEMFTLRSVGIDIGTSTTHLVFSRLTLRREGAAFSARFRVTDRELLYKSNIMLTPYVKGTLMDTQRIREFVHQTYQDAGFTSDDIDTGAVVITGEALKKENARPIAEFFSQDSGKFICASAGPNHEAVLAAYGCGAVALSKAEKAVVLNVDMGGGTAKFSLIRDGVVAQTAAVNVGARLIAFDAEGIVTRVEEPARRIMAETGGTVALGERLDERDTEEFARAMTRVLWDVILGRSYSPLTQDLMITDRLAIAPDLEGVDAVVFSGGVSEYVYDHERTSYGDLGPLFGRFTREEATRLAKDGMVREPVEGIRATVIGAGEYTMQASGNTSYISSTSALPAFGLQVVRPMIEDGVAVDRAVRNALAKFDLEEMIPGLALAISLNGQQNYQTLRRVADGIASASKGLDGHDDPLFLVLNIDVAKSLGGILREELAVGREIVAVDGIDVGDLEYVDIGRPVGTSEVLPVTVKSLLFPSEAQA